MLDACTVMSGQESPASLPIIRVLTFKIWVPTIKLRFYFIHLCLL